MPVIHLPRGFSPRDYQIKSNRAFFIENKRFHIDIIHRRGGKSINALNRMIGAAMQKVGMYFHLFPELQQARTAIWNGIDKEGKRYLDYIPKILIDGNPNNTDMRINLINGSIIKLAGSDRYDKLMGSNPAGIVFDEYSIQNPFAWHYLSPILTENGGWAHFVYTPRGANHGQKLYLKNIDNPEWFVQKLDVTQTYKLDGTPVVTEEQVEKRRRDGTPEELIQQEYYCSFDAALVGAYYSDQIVTAYDEGRIRDFEINPNFPVFTAWDLARTRDANSIWIFQVINQQIFLFDYIEGHMNTMQHYIRQLGNFAREHGIVYDMHFAPHDIRVTDYTSEKSRLEVAASMGFFFTVADKLSIIDGIDAVKTLFPRMVFHKTNCELGLDCLKQYRRNEYGKPIHDFASHCADSLRTLATGWYSTYLGEKDFYSFTARKTGW